ncbi:MAG: DUF5673 domain-containing protein [Gallicola sp.]|nr:DUF5673 domain-containing protein [Gallicola sp.]
MYIIILLVILLAFIIFRNARAKHPLYIYKTKVLEDRFIEVLFAFISTIWALIKVFEIKALGQGDLGREVLPYLIAVAIIFIVISIEYNKYQVGLYETGILYKSQFFPWKKIYTYRINPASHGKKITFYIHKGENTDQLQKNNIYVSDTRALEMEKILETKLDVTKS